MADQWLAAAEIPLEAVMEDDSSLGIISDSISVDVNSNQLVVEDWPTEVADIDAMVARHELPCQPSPAEHEMLQHHAEVRGYGTFYAAFGGGRAGLEACAAGKARKEGSCGSSSAFIHYWMNANTPASWCMVQRACI